MKSFRKKPNIPALLLCALLSWLIAITAEYLLLPEHCRRLDGLEAVFKMSAFRTVVIFLLSFSVLSLFSGKFVKTGQKSLYHRGILFTFVLLAATSLRASFTPAFFAACCLLFIRLIFDCKCTLSYTALTDNISKTTDKHPTKYIVPHNQKTEKRFLRITVLLSVLFFLFVSVWTVGRVSCFSTPTFDFGIFSQMFHYMKTTGFPYTTLERDGLLSHFHVHISPVYYLLLPFYCLAPAPATLQVLQAAVITSAVIPLWKLGRHHGLTPFQRLLLCALMLLYPAFSGGAAYDIHENCFLTPLLLWLFYGIARKNSLLTAAAALLTMLVKEDAPVYVACVALWTLAGSFLHSAGQFFPQPSASFFPHGNGCSNHSNTDCPCRSDNRYPYFNDTDHSHPRRWEIITGAFMLTASLAYFFAATSYLAAYGDGLMTNRYGNFFSGSASLFSSLLRTAFLCPMKVVYECTDSDKLWFIAVTILPLLGLPLLTRRWERYLLLIPYILVNLMPDYAYQHDIFFQYTFGSTACLLYLTMINLADLQPKPGDPKPTDAAKAASSLTATEVTSSSTAALSPVTTAVLAAAAICAVCFATTIVPKAASYPSRYIGSRKHYQELRHALSEIPGEASVTASSFYTTFLSQRDVLYDIHYASKEHLLSTEFVVLAPGSENDFKQYAADGKTGYEGLTKLLCENGYQLNAEISETLEIYRRPFASSTY